MQPFESPFPAEAAANKLDLVTLMFNYHDLGFLGVDRAQMNKAVFAALKPGGMYVIADHSGRPGTGISESGTLHRIEEAFLRKEVEAAGFKLVEEGNFMRNPSDPRDKNTPDPPQPKDVSSSNSSSRSLAANRIRATRSANVRPLSAEGAFSESSQAC